MGRHVRIGLLADHPDLVGVVGILRWTEWGYDDPSPEGWIRVTAGEAGRHDLPVTFVALDDDGGAVGAVALGEVDDALSDEERDRRTPWLLGMVVRRGDRRRGVGRMLVRALEDLAAARGHDHVWVVTGANAVGFYRACGWTDTQRLVTSQEQIESTVLIRSLEPG